MGEDKPTFDKTLPADVANTSYPLMYPPVMTGGLNVNIIPPLGYSAVTTFVGEPGALVIKAVFTG
jgi:hypothetical protein